MRLDAGGLADRERNVRAGQAEVGELAVGHAEKLGLGGTQAEIGLESPEEATGLTAGPKDGFGD